MSDLRDTGQGFYDSVTDYWALHAGALEVLRQAALVLDQIADCDEIVRREGIITTGARGQPMAHPAVQLAKQLRTTFAQMVAKLHLPYEDDDPARVGRPGKSYG